MTVKYNENYSKISRLAENTRSLQCQERYFRIFLFFIFGYNCRYVSTLPVSDCSHRPT